jgi:hypothetical protein
MKKFRLFAAFIMVALCAAVVISCDKDDDDDGNALSGKKLTRLEWESNEGIEELIFEYDNGKLIKVRNAADERYTMNITYSGKKVAFSVPGEGSATALLNNDGFVESFEDEWGVDTYEYTNGYLTKVKEGDYYTYTFQYDNNGNYLGSHDSYNSKTIVKSSLNHSYKGRIFVFTYDWLEGYELFSGIAGLLGKEPNNLISESESTSGDGADGQYLENKKYDYTFDKDGYVTSVKITEESKYRRTPNDTYTNYHTYTNTCKFTYE